MAVTTQQSVDLREPSGWRRAKNRIVTGGMWFAFLCMLVPLGFVLVTVIAKGASTISWQFLTNNTIPPNILPANIGGMGVLLFGLTIIVNLTARAVVERNARKMRGTA